MSQTARNGNRTSGIAASRWVIATWVVGMVGVVGYPAQAIPLGNNTEEACAALLKQDLPPSAIGLPSGTAAIESSAIVAAVPTAAPATQNGQLNGNGLQYGNYWALAAESGSWERV